MYLRSSCQRQINGLFSTKIGIAIDIKKLGKQVLVHKLVQDAFYGHILNSKTLYYKVSQISYLICNG